jgi:hypothetical protein
MTGTASAGYAVVIAPSLSGRQLISNVPPQSSNSVAVGAIADVADARSKRRFCPCVSVYIDVGPEDDRPCWQCIIPSALWDIAAFSLAVIADATSREIQA